MSIDLLDSLKPLASILDTIYIDINNINSKVNYLNHKKSVFKDYLEKLEKKVDLFYSNNNNNASNSSLINTSKSINHSILSSITKSNADDKLFNDPSFPIKRDSVITNIVPSPTISNIFKITSPTISNNLPNSSNISKVRLNSDMSPNYSNSSRPISTLPYDEHFINGRSDSRISDISTDKTGISTDWDRNKNYEYKQPLFLINKDVGINRKKSIKNNGISYLKRPSVTTSSNDSRKSSVTSMSNSVGKLNNNSNNPLFNSSNDKIMTKSENFNYPNSFQSPPINTKRINSLKSTSKLEHTSLNKIPRNSISNSSIPKFNSPIIKSHNSETNLIRRSSQPIISNSTPVSEKIRSSSISMSNSISIPLIPKLNFVRINSYDSNKSAVNVMSVSYLENQKRNNIIRKENHLLRLKERADLKFENEIKRKDNERKKLNKWEKNLFLANLRKNQLHAPLIQKNERSKFIEQNTSPLKFDTTSGSDDSFTSDPEDYSADDDSYSDSDSILGDVVDNIGVNIDRHIDRLNLTNISNSFDSAELKDLESPFNLKNSQEVDSPLLFVLTRASFCINLLKFLNLGEVLNLFSVSSKFTLLFYSYFYSYYNLNAYFDRHSWITDRPYLQRTLNSIEQFQYKLGGRKLIDLCNSPINIPLTFREALKYLNYDAFSTSFRQSDYEIVGEKYQEPNDYRISTKEGHYLEAIILYLIFDKKRSTYFCLRVFEEDSRLKRQKDHLFAVPWLHQSIFHCITNSFDCKTSEVDRILPEVSMHFPLQGGNWVMLRNDIDTQVDKMFWITACEYFPYGSMRDIMQRRNYCKLNDSQVSRVAYYLLLALKKLHVQDIAHHAIHSRNVYITSNGQVKLEHFTNTFNFMDAMFPSTEENRPASHVEYITPELVTDPNVTDFKAGDIYCLGHIIYELVTGKRFGVSMPKTKLVFAIATKTIPLPQDISAVLGDFMKLCLERDPKNRPSANELLHHPFCKLRGDNSCLSSTELFSGKELIEFYGNTGFVEMGFRAVSNSSSLPWLKTY